MRTNNKRTNRLKLTLLMSAAIFIMASCGGGNDKPAAAPAASMVEDAPDPKTDKGVGKFANQTLELGALDIKMAEAGKAVFEKKCTACHRVTDQKIVGPGLKDVTNKARPEWILNMITNPLEMTQKDPIAKSLFETHLTQMTFQDVTDEDARNILEYLRQNDGVK